MPTMKPTPARWQVVAKAVRDCMDDLNMRQADLVRESGLSDPTIRSFMTGKFRGDPQPYTIRSLEAALLWPKYTVDRILAGEDPDRVIETGEPATPPRGTQRYATIEMLDRTTAQLQQLTTRVLQLEAHVDGLRREQPG